MGANELAEGVKRASAVWGVPWGPGAWWRFCTEECGGNWELGTGTPLLSPSWASSPVGSGRR